MRITEENVIQQIKVKNEKALTFIIQQYGGLIHSVIHHHLNQSREDQEECLDDVLLSIWSHIDSYNSSKNTFKNWVAAVTKYKAIDYQRKHLKQLEKQFTVSEVEDSMISRKEDALKRDVHSLLEQLSTDDRQLFERYYLQSQSSSEIAKDLNVKESWIYNRLSRGRKKLRHFLTQNNEG
ncbi:sigma-70 family RNA polymerase sigma factor [Bacillus sp. 31A1R]|uniref:Sigma-70 family RNA polymerase sigma factor n=1 Tax=Robertmurraya mangrovi TaxID=3098077 RepID=A0ABU5J125_9BACI|nr:sigma-70 family RNA polymerase sigma factor [Bacillus sp. 31A1R]MDZ5473108.1 sigma-70 family RNA polymerase sigma factor [Bacillus sp. 31A1R]